ncbi:glycoside hydrolase family 36 protein [Planctomonas psychrotolerans]|uniref:glycoside hydrolase family 36 protein n=1 Tax=Planctomonas psychrotolerans TaxID=2528712 RepID=UPI0012397C0D|nr:glycoside hydrolase family 36 protein [Planctomonas psychrotolerans]
MTTFEWNNSRISLVFTAEADGPVRLVGITDLGPDGAERAEDPALVDPIRAARQPLVEVLAPAYGRNNNSYRYDGTTLGAGLRYVSHDATIATGTGTGMDRLEIVQSHAESGLRTTSVFEAVPGVPAVRSTTTVTVDDGSDPLLVWAVTSFATGALLSDAINDLDVWQAASSWCAENRWSSSPLRTPGLAAIDREARGETSRNRLGVTSLSTWSSGTYNPIGAVTNRVTGAALAWQIEHNGAWHWEAGENPDWAGGAVPIEKRVRSAEPAGPPRGDRSRDGAYVAVLGPTDTLHDWSTTLDGSNPFTTVPATVTVAGSLEDAFAGLAAHRRATRRAHPQNDALPVIFNDYMNTLEGDPTEAKLLPLIERAAEVGAEYFCIDAGWYDDTAGWWSSVGDWQPSTARFPSGLASILDTIRGHGMVPGLWLEPEVVGVTSRAATDLPDDAFLQRHGAHGSVRVREHDRYLLDLRSPAARAHLDATVDRLVSDLGVGFFKLDYNVTPGTGTDADAESAGAGLLAHNRALITWLEGVLDRHPDLVLENCGSGAMRSDFAMLGVCQLQSTSDQQDPLLYPLIAVGALAHILPEQAGNWAYPQPDMDDEEIVFTMCTGLAGRLYQAGVLSGMDGHRRNLVAAGVAAHKATRHTLARSTPRFPLGLPTWDDGWTSVAFDAPADAGSPAETLVLAWRQAHADAMVELPLPSLGSGEVTVEQVYPPEAVGATWTAERTAGGLRIVAPGSGASARMYRLTRA